MRALAQRLHAGHEEREEKQEHGVAGRIPPQRCRQRQHAVRREFQHAPRIQSRLAEEQGRGE